MRRFEKLSFRMQLTISLFSCLFFSIIVIIVCLILNIREAEQSGRLYIEQLNQQWMTELSFMMDRVDRMRFLHFSDDEVMQIIGERWDTERQDLRIQNEKYMSRLLNVLCTINSDVLRVTVETSSGNVYRNYVEDPLSSVELAKEHLIYSKKQYKQEMAVTDVYEGDINLVPYSLVTFCYSLYDVSMSERMGVIYIDINFGAIRERFDAVEKQEGWSNYILNGDHIIYGSDADIAAEIDAESREKIMEMAQMGRENGNLRIGNHKYMVNVKYMEETDWYLIQCVQKNAYISRQMKGAYLLALWVILLLFGLICAGTLMMKKISAPIEEFSQVMSRVATKENQEINYMEYRDNYPAEICEIVQGYNTMVDRIQKNIIQEYANELNNKKTELQMLQYQINPHFLYNTLNTMSAIARLHESPYISDISESLSKIFYYNVKGGQIATLQEELDNLQHYIRIQTIRFPGKFEVRYQIEQGLEKSRILKFLLQPLVENAISHGVVKKRGKGEIIIEARQNEHGEGEILIQDNGAGIKAPELEKLQRMLAEGKKSSLHEEEPKIGILNVHMRVQNYYGKQYGITLESQEGDGTKVRITFRVFTEKSE